MDLESTLIRAEALFRRFKRLVEAIDKKGNFPPPRLRSPPSTPGGSSSRAQDGSSSPGGDTDKGPEDTKAKKVISPELRKLLSREIEVLPRQTVASKGDGFTAGRK
jgi:TBC1 domain family member 15